MDYKCFTLGRTILEEMQRAVAESRYTLAVLTPAYLESNFTELENIMAQHLGLEEGQYRLLSVIREECKPDLRMRINLMLDMTDDREFEMNMSRLVDRLRLPPPQR